MSDTPVSADSARDTGVVDHDNPWPGLAAFRESDQAYFHGRDASITALTELVTRARLSVLYGVSGLGKTSLIQAGLFPRVRAHDLFPVRIRLGLNQSSEPLAEQVCAALGREAAERKIKAPTRNEGETLWEFFYRKDALWWSDRHHILTPLLVFDQFEEIFTIGRRHADVASSVQQFLDDLRGIILGSPPDAVRARCDADPDQALRYSLSRCPVRVLFSFREDYLAEFLELRDAFPAVGEQNCRLLRMSTGDALSVIQKAGSHLVDAAVARRMVEIIAAAKSARTRAATDLVVDPALLSVFCRELNNERRGKPQDRITDDLLEDRQARILENFYARSFIGLDPAVQIFVENELLLPDSAERNSVAEQVALRRPGVTLDAIDSLIERRLLRRDERDGPPRLELTHDVLIEPTRRSRDLRLAREAEERRLAAVRATEEESRHAAAEAQERERQELLLQVERAKSERAASELRHQQDKRRRVQGFLVVAAVLAIFAGFQWYRANEEGKAVKRALAAVGLIQASSKYEGEGRSDIALAYLGYAARSDPTDPYARGRLVDALLHRTWPLPRAILRHDGPVGWAQFTADGARVLTASAAKGSVRIWPIAPATGQPVRTLDGAELAHVDATGRYALVITRERNLEVWDTGTGRTLRTIEAMGTKSGGSDQLDTITTAAFDPGATRIATGTEGGVIRLWSITETTPTPEWTNAGPSVRREREIFTSSQPPSVGLLQFNDDGSRLLAWSDTSGLARILDSPTGQELARFSDDGLLDAQFAPNAPLLITASGGNLRLWRVPEDVPIRSRRPLPTDGVPLLEARVHEGWVRSVRFSRDGVRIVTASDDGTARIWRLDVGIDIDPKRYGGFRYSYAIGSPGTPPLRHRRGVVTAFFSPDGSRVVSASLDKSARVWDAETGAAITEPLWHNESLGSAVFSADGERVVTASDDGTAEVWDVRPGSELPEMLSGGGRAQFSPDGSSVLLNGAGPPTIWTLGSNRAQEAASHSVGDEAEFSNDGTTFLTVEISNARTWKTTTAEPASAPMDHGTAAIWAARFSPDGDRIATFASDGNVRFWNARSGALLNRPIAVVARTDGQLAAVDISRDLTFAAVATTSDSENRLVVWDVSRNPAARVLDRTTSSQPTSLLFDTARKWLLGVFDAESALVWPIPSSSADAPLRLAHDGVIASGRFSPNGDRIVTASRDSTARIWKHSAGTFVALADLRHDNWVQWADFSPDGLRVVTASADRTARLWDAATGSPASVPLPHGGSPVNMARFSADSEKLVTTSEDNVARVWHVPVGRAADVLALSSLVEAISGYSVRDDGTQVQLDQIARLEAERQTLARPANPNAMPHRLGKWLLEDRWNRTISPFSSIPLEQYLKQHMSDATESGLSLTRLYAGHPALRGKTGPQQ